LGESFLLEWPKPTGALSRAAELEAQLAARKTGGAVAQRKKFRAFKFRCARGISTARNSRSTTGAAIPSRSGRSCVESARHGASCFDVDDYENYVRVQSESALRHLASAYAYDHGEENEVTLRSGVDEVSQALKTGIAGPLDKAGVQVEEARLTHLAYAPEIARRCCAGNRPKQSLRPAKRSFTRRQHGGHGAERIGGKSG